MEILGLVFAGTATHRRAAMTQFIGATLGLPRVPDSGPADMFAVPGGGWFAVADEREIGGGTSRTVGFLVADLDAAVAELRAAGIEVATPASSDRHRYAHFIAPDGELYELIQER